MSIPNPEKLPSKSAAKFSSISDISACGLTRDKLILLLECLALFIPVLLLPVGTIPVPWGSAKLFAEGKFGSVLRVGDGGDSSSLIGGCNSLVDTDDAIAAAFSAC